MKNIKINLTELGIRLGLVVAKYPDGRKGAEAIAIISPFTLDRWLAGKSPKMPLLPLAQICKGQNVRMDWLLYGDKYPMQLEIITRFGVAIDVEKTKEFLKNEPFSYRPPYATKTMQGGTAWEEKLFLWINTPDACADYYFMYEIFERALGIEKAAITTAQEGAVSNFLKNNGWVEQRIIINRTSRIVFLPALNNEEKEPGNEES